MYECVDLAELCLLIDSPPVTLTFIGGIEGTNDHCYKKRQNGKPKRYCQQRSDLSAQLALKISHAQEFRLPNSHSRRCET